MGTTAGPGRRLRRGLGVVGCTLLTMAAAGCAQPEPDEQEVAQAVRGLPGVKGVDASFIGTSLGGAGDQEISVQVASPPDPREVEELVRSLPQTLRRIEHADGYDELVLTTRDLGERAEVSTDPSSLGFGSEPPLPGLATRWAKAVATSPPGGLQVRSRPAPRRVTASVSSHEPVSTALGWALRSGLPELDWTVVEYQTPQAPYVRFSAGRPLVAPMVDEWRAIEATYAGQDGSASIARVVVVEDVEGVRRVRVVVSLPEMGGPLAEAAHGAWVWPIVEAAHDSMPAGHRLDLELGRSERGAQNGGAGDADLVDGGTGSADWEAAYRQRFPDAVPVSVTPG
ncbi:MULTISPECIES: hypothetical protein [unclassified Knoellia]|uniref:hypothetical protein n=1 Tax=Knoellia altitudinis TaxID=3404795 RepID=UPI003613DED9